MKGTIQRKERLQKPGKGYLFGKKSFPKKREFKFKRRNFRIIRNEACEESLEKKLQKKALTKGYFCVQKVFFWSKKVGDVH